VKPTGSLCAIVTPFDGEGAVDLAAFAALVEWHRAAGTAGIVVAGSTGESGALDDHEYEALLDVALARAGVDAGHRVYFTTAADLAAIEAVAATISASRAARLASKLIWLPPPNSFPRGDDDASLLS